MTDAPGTDGLEWRPAQLIFHDRLDRAIIWADRHGGRAAVLLVDVDPGRMGAKPRGVEDALELVGRHLEEALRAVDSVFRIEERRFAVLLPEVDSAAGAGVVAGKLVEAAAGSEAAGVVVGVGVYPDHALSMDALLRAADEALVRARDRGNGTFEVPDASAPPDGA